MTSLLSTADSASSTRMQTEEELLAHFRQSVRMVEWKPVWISQYSDIK